MDRTELLSESTRFLSASSESFFIADVARLQDIVREHNRLYYTEESPVISDREYDLLFKLLIALEERFAIFDRSSPTKRIDVLLTSQFSKGLHASPMISLDNTYDVHDIADFEQRIRNIVGDNTPLSYFIELKFDGLGLSLTYRDGVLVRALTRGNGVEGEDVTVNALQIASIPRTIPFTDAEIEIRGEVVLPNSEFSRINAERAESGEKLFANPRNAASGSLRQIDYTVTKSRNLRFYAYSFPLLETEIGRKQVMKNLQEEMNMKNNSSSQNFSGNESFDLSQVASEKYPGSTTYEKTIESEWENKEDSESSSEWRLETIETYSDYVRVLRSFGFTTTPYWHEAKNLSDLTNEIVRMTEERPTFEFEIDGLVLKLQDLSLWNRLGTTEHHPRYAIAYKFPAMQVRTKLLDIEHSIGRTGTITPVAILDPVNISGVTVSRATLHNYDELAKKGIRIGDQVFVIRAGEVIPEVIAPIVEVRTGAEQVILIPTECPACGTALQRNEGKVALFCPNRHGCPAQIQGKMEVFVGKHGMDIDGFGTKLVELFLDKEWITDFVSVYHLSDYREQMLGLEGFKEKSVSNLIAAIEASRRVDFANFLVALGIPQVGRKTGKILAKYVAEKLKVESWKLQEGEERRDEREEVNKENNPSSQNFSGNKSFNLSQVASEKYPGSTAYEKTIESEWGKKEDIESRTARQENEDFDWSTEISEWDSRLPPGDPLLLRNSPCRGNDGVLVSQKLSTILTHLTYEELESIHDIGPVGAGSIVYYFEENEELLERLIAELDIILPPVSSSSEQKNLPLAGKSFCVTGSFEGISRDEIHAIVEENGGEVRTSVSSKLDYLVVGSEAGSKLEKAKELGVTILSLEWFQQLL